VDVCEPCACLTCGAGDCFGKAAAVCTGGSELPKALPGHFRIALIEPLKDSWAHIANLPRVIALAKQQAGLVVQESAHRLVKQPSAPLIDPNGNLTIAQKYIMVQCVSEQACLVDNVCLEGHEGTACQWCATGFTRNRNRNRKFTSQAFTQSIQQNRTPPVCRSRAHLCTLLTQPGGLQRCSRHTQSAPLIYARACPSMATSTLQGSHSSLKTRTPELVHWSHLTTSPTCTRISHSRCSLCAS